MSNPFSIKRPSFNEKMYQSNIMLSLDSKYNLHIVKNRFEAPTKENLNVDEAIDITSEILTQMVCNGQMNLIQGVMKNKLVEVMTKVIKENKLYDTSI